MKLIKFDQKIGKASDELKMLQHDKDTVLMKFNILRDHLKPQRYLIEK